MQIDFHHAVTYVAARIAGFKPGEAEIIAYAAQYVDDATSSGAVFFDNKALYSRISSAHKSVDLDNMNDLENQMVWLPFHFLPGNGGLGVGQNPTGSFINKIVCRSDSPIAQEMVAAAIRDQDKPYSLHRLGITMHVYADTWAHQGFAGVLNEINEVENAEETSNTGEFSGGLPEFLNGILEDAVPPLGHGRANILPDMPFLSWRYLNGKNQTIDHNNTVNFCDAANALCVAMQRYLQKDPEAAVSGIDSTEMQKIRNLFSNQPTKDGKKRHQAWLAAIKAGKFSFGSETISYAEDGKQSWKAQALGTSIDIPVHTYQSTFLTSNWKLFHDALQLHRLTVLHDILPRYGICGA
jgi:hypothetical protein